MTSPPPLRFYERPSGKVLQLAITPRLASWDAGIHPSQVALKEYLRSVSELLDAPSLPDAGLALMLSVGLAEGVDPAVGGRDLDNYLFPLAQHLGSQRFDCVWGRKGVGTSSITVGPAVRLPEGHGPDEWSVAHANTMASASTAAWKEEIARQIIGEPIPEGPVELHVAFKIGPTRNWANLWKPAIDSLENVLGAGPRRFHPRDDRIVILGMHRTLDPVLGNAVELEFRWRSCGPEWT